MAKNLSPKDKARERLNRVSTSIEIETRRNNKENRLPVKGHRAEFLEKYKTEGYEKAKEYVNSGFENIVFDDKILEKWLEEEKLKENENER